MQEADISTPGAYGSASCIFDKEKVMYIATGNRAKPSEDRILAVDRGKSQLSVLASLHVGPGPKEYSRDRITSIVCISHPTRLVAALQDGRLAVVGVSVKKPTSSSKPAVLR